MSSTAFTSGKDGANPFSGLIFDSAGNLYGTNFFGVVYELTPSQSGWSEQTLQEAFDKMVAVDRNSSPQSSDSLGRKL